MLPSKIEVIMLRFMKRNIRVSTAENAAFIGFLKELNYPTEPAAFDPGQTVIGVPITHFSEKPVEFADLPQAPHQNISKEEFCALSDAWTNVVRQL